MPARVYQNACGKPDDPRIIACGDARGVILPPHVYRTKVQKVLARHDILRIADEINCGSGGTGDRFAFETCGIPPDMMTMAQPLTAGSFRLRLWQ